MFSTIQLNILNAAKAQGKEWHDIMYAEVFKEIQEKIETDFLFDSFRRELFNQRDPVVVIDIPRFKETNHAMSDPIDVHELMLEYDGYETLAGELDHAQLLYKALPDTIQLKLKYDPPEVVGPPPVIRASSRPPPSDADDEGSPVARRLDFDEENSYFLRPGWATPNREEETVLNPEDADLNTVTYWSGH